MSATGELGINGTNGEGGLSLRPGPDGTVVVELTPPGLAGLFGPGPNNRITVQAADLLWLVEHAAEVGA